MEVGASREEEGGNCGGGEAAGRGRKEEPRGDPGDLAEEGPGDPGRGVGGGEAVCGMVQPMAIAAEVTLHVNH